MSRPMTLMQIQASGIQSYIFGSNNLRHNIGASELVERSTTEWVTDALQKQNLSSNVSWNEQEIGLEWGQTTIESGAIQAEVLYAGGGNALLLVEATASILIEFVKTLTYRVLRDAPGLNLGIATQLLDWDQDSTLADVHQQLWQDGSRLKYLPTSSTPLVGLGVTAMCDFTGLPAVTRDIDEHLLSRVADAKRRAFKQAETRLRKFLPKSGPGEFNLDLNKIMFVYDFDQFGKQAESSYLAVIHADGNQMGKRFRDFAPEGQPVSNREYITRLRKLSLAVHKKALVALQATITMLLKNLERDEEGKGWFAEVVPLPEKQRLDLETGKLEFDDTGSPVMQEYIPFRPIVFGGDDVTFVCEGRLGLALARKYLAELAQGNLPGKESDTDGDPLYARAGVAIVKAHYPFSRAYELASELAESAKKALGGDTGTVLDWHIATGGVVLPLNEVRAREYVADTGASLLMRPVWCVIPQDKNTHWRTWQNLNSVTSKFKDGADWAGKRNKVKALRDALRGGPDRVRLFRQEYSLQKLPPIDDNPTMAEQGWGGPGDTECGYFDAVEAADFYVPLKEQSNGDAKPMAGTGTGK